jgi:hypothetical protein
MKRYTIGLATGALLAVSAMMFMGSQNKNLGNITANSITIINENGKDAVLIGSSNGAGIIRLNKPDGNMQLVLYDDLRIYSKSPLHMDLSLPIIKLGYQSDGMLGRRWFNNYGLTIYDTLAHQHLAFIGVDYLSNKLGTGHVYVNDFGNNESNQLRPKP